MAKVWLRSRVARLRELQDELDAAKADPKRNPGHWGSEELARDTAAGDALPALLAVVEAAQEVHGHLRREFSHSLDMQTLGKALRALHSQSSDEGEA